MKTSIIYNPAAGSVKIAKLSAKHCGDFPAPKFISPRRKGTRPVSRRTQSNKGKTWSFVAAGAADGTLNEVINGIARHADRIQIGLVPLGTGSDFARTLALPGSIEDCIQILRVARRERSTWCG